MKLCKKGKMLENRLYSIAYINNLESENLVDSIKMILKKGLELELLVEFNFEVTPEELINMLKRVSLMNYMQRRFQYVVQSELVESI